VIDKLEPYKQELAERVIDDITLYSRTTWSRSLPSVHDGLKSVHRRCLFTYWENVKDGSIKVVKLTGLTLAYHPHGDSSINNAIIDMTCDATNNHPLFKGEGSFGNISSFVAASPRYISVRVSDFGKHVMMESIDTNTLDMVAGEDLDTREPAYLPSKIPLVLINGSYGISEIFVNNIPQHNLNEIADRCIRYIKNKSIPDTELTKDLYPDYVSGGVIVNGSELSKMYSGGSGSIKLRGEVEIDKEGDRILIRSLPHNVDQTTIIDQIRKLVYGEGKSDSPKNVALSNVTFVGDEVDKKSGVPYIFLNCKQGTNLKEVENNLYKNTSLEKSINVSMTLNENGVVHTCTLKDIIRHWYTVNYNIKSRKLTLAINKLENKIHVLEGILKVYPNIDAIVALIKTFTGTKEELTNLLSNKYGLSLIQARSICEMQISDLSRRSENDLKKSINDNKEKVRVLSDELNHIDDLMINDIIDLKNRFGRQRRTRIVQELDESGIHLVSNGVILFTRNSFSLFHLDSVLNKRTYLDFKGVKIDEKWVREITGYHQVTSDIKSVLVFYSDKTASPVPVSLINKWLVDPNCEKHGFITAVCPIYDKVNGTVVCITSKGLIKRFDPKEIRSKNVNIDTVVEKCIFVPKDQGDNMLLLIDENGHYRYFPLDDIRETGRNSQGVMSGFDKAHLKIAVVDKEATHAVVMLENGNGEGLCYSVELEKIDTTTRSTKLRKIAKLDDVKFSGVGTLNLNVKEMLVVFLTRSLIASCSGRVLRGMKTLRRLGSNPSFGLIDVKL